MPEVCLGWLKCALGGLGERVRVCARKRRFALGCIKVVEVCPSCFLGFRNVSETPEVCSRRPSYVFGGFTT
jgi:hypothetical protein